MAYRVSAPLGVPCWVDLWTSNIDESRRFYSELFDWRAEEPNTEFGGYFMFTRAGVPVAGAMGDLGDLRGNNTWKPYFASADIERTLSLAIAHGATLNLPVTEIGDLGRQAVIVDPAGAITGIWESGTFSGFTAVHEPGTPSFIAIDVYDYRIEVAFYRKVFGWNPLEEEADGHHYAGFMDEHARRPIAGIGDEVDSLTPGESPSWSVFWQCDDIDVSVEKVRALGGGVVSKTAQGGLGRVARVTDPSGARFWLLQPKS